MKKKQKIVSAMTANEVRTELHAIDEELLAVKTRKSQLEERRTALISSAQHVLLGFQGKNQEEKDESIDSLKIGIRTAHRLREGNVRTINRLLKMSRRGLLKIPRLGRKSVSEIMHALEAKGLNADHLKEPKKR